MRFTFSSSAKKQAVRKLLANACRLESLESRQLLSSYYVSTSGSDSGDGTINSPWQTVQHAVNAVDSGDVINLRAGDYAGGIRIDKPNITIQSKPGEQASITSSAFDSSVAGTVVFGIDASGGKLLNLDISGGYYYTIKTESNWGSGDPKEYAASNILIQNTKLHGSGRDVVKITPGSDDVSFIGVEIYDSGLRDASNAEGIDNVNGDRMIVRDSYIHDTATTGVYAKGGSIGSIIENSRFDNIGTCGVILGQDSDPEWFDLQANPETYESIDGIVRNNIITNTKAAGIAVWAALRPQVFNNTLINVATEVQGGILINSQDHYYPPDYSSYSTIPTVDPVISNNIVVSPRPAVNIRSLEGTLTMDNNIFYNPNGPTKFQDDTKSFYGDFAAWKALRGTDAHSIVANPQLNANGQLTGNSPAVDAGKTLPSFSYDITGRARPAGKAWDIGAYELGATGQPDPGTDPGTDPDPGTTPTEPWENHAIETQTGNFTVDFDVQITQPDSDIVVGFSNGAADEYTDMGPMLQFNGDDGSINARNGGAYASQTPLSYAVGTNYHVQMVIRADQHTYDLYLTPEGGSPILVGQNYAFRSEQSAVPSLDNWVKSTWSGDATVSNFALAPTITA